MSSRENQVADLLKAIGTVVAIFIAIFAVVFAVELACTVLVKITSNTRPDLSLWPLLFTHFAGLIAAVLAIKSLRSFQVFGRALGGALAGFVGASLAFYMTPSMSNRNLLVSGILGAAISASIGKSGDVTKSQGGVTRNTNPAA